MTEYHVIFTMDDPIIKLAVLHRELTVNGQLSQSSIDWLQEALRALVSGEVETLDKAFGVNARRGVSNPGPRLRALLRNQILIRILKQYTMKNMLEWPAAIELGKELKKFKSITYQRMKINRERVDNATELELQLLALFGFDDNPPCSTSFLHGLFTETPVFTEEEINNTGNIEIGGNSHAT